MENIFHPQSDFIWALEQIFTFYIKAEKIQILETNIWLLWSFLL